MLKWEDPDHSGTDHGLAIDDVTIAWTAAPTVNIDNTGTPAAGNVTAGASDVSLFGFRLTPAGSVDFTALNLSTAGSANSSDLSNFRVVYDADNSGTFNGGDSVVSGSGLSLANPIGFTIAGQTGVNVARRYLVVADVAAGATPGNTFAGSVAAAGDVTTTGNESGTAAGNQITIVAATTPTVSVTGGPLSFGNVVVNTFSSEQSVSVEGINLTADITVTPPAGFEISTNSGSGFSSSPIILAQSSGTVPSTAIYAVLKPTLVQAYAGNLVAVSTGATTADAALSGAGVYSSASDIVADGGFTHPANIAYDSYQETDLTAASLAVAQFVLRDGGGSADADAAGTTLSAISFSVVNSANLRRVALYDDANNELGEVAAGATVTFSSLSLAATDGGTKTLTLRASFQSTVTDNEQFSFAVSSATASASGSGFAAADAGGAVSSIAGDDNRIEVAATTLAFSSVPTSVAVNQNFAISVQARDANGNLDLDDTTSATLSKASGSGTLSSTTGLTQSLVAGANTWTDVQISSTGIFTIQAAGGSLTSATSGAIASALLLLEENFDYGAGDNLTDHGWTAHSAGGTNPIKVQSPGLTNNTYSSSGIGLAASMSGSGEDDNLAFTPQTAGSVYAAILVNASVAQSGDYFFHFLETSSFFHGRVYIKKDPGSSSFAFGLSRTSESATYTGYSYSLNTTYLLVLKYTFNGGSQDDSVALFVSPASGAIEPAPTIGPLATAVNDALTLPAIALRQGGSSSAPTVSVDGIRVGKTWAAVVNHKPVATNLTLGVAVGDSISFPVIGGKYAPTDADGDALTVTNATPASSGTSGFTATDVTYTANGGSGTHNFTYTVADPYGATDTKTVTVIVFPANTGANIVPGTLSVNDGVATMQAFGIPGALYRLQYTENLTPPSWTDTGSDTQASPANGSLNLTDPGASGPMRYYRTRYVSGP